MSGGDVILCLVCSVVVSYSKMANKSHVEELPSPSDKLLVSPVSQLVEADDKVKMKKQLGLLEGCAIIVGIICGSGIIKTTIWFCLFIFVVSFFRNIYFTERYYSRGVFTRFFSSCMGVMWPTFHDWSFMLCRTGHVNTKVRGRLCLYL